MMKPLQFFFWFWLFFITCPVYPQANLSDSLKRELLRQPSAQDKINIYSQLSSSYRFINNHKSFIYALKTLELSYSINDLRGKALAHLNIGTIYFYQGNIPKALENVQKSMAIGERLKDTTLITNSLTELYYIFSEVKDFKKAMELIDRRLEISMKKANKRDIVFCLNHKAYVFGELGKTDIALALFKEGIRMASAISEIELLATLYNNLGNTYRDGLHNSDSALYYHNKALSIKKQMFDNYNMGYTYILIGKDFIQKGDYPTAESYIIEGLDSCKNYNAYYGLKLGYDALYQMFKKKKRIEKALFYKELFHHLSDSIFNAENINLMANVRLDFEMEQKEEQIAAHKEEIKNKDITINYFMTGAIVAFIFSIAIYLIYLDKKKINRLLMLKNEELNLRNEEINAQRYLLEEQYEEIQTQANELVYANNEISLINANLESAVAQRTQKLKLQKDTLLEYGFLNSHKLRAPISRLLGLLSLMNMEKDYDMLQIYLNHFKSSVDELDLLTREMTLKINDTLD